MQGFKLLLVEFITLIVGFLCAEFVYAQTSLTSTPSQLIIEIQRGSVLTHTVLTRTLILSATENISELQVIPSDLISTTAFKVISATNIKTAASAKNIDKQGSVTIPVTFDLRAVPRGIYTGQLLIKYNSGQLSVPMTVTVKSSFPLGLFMLVVGVAAFLGVMAYRAKGLTPENIGQRAEELRAQLQNDGEMPETFKSLIQGLLAETQRALVDKKTQELLKKMEQAENIWVLWSKQRKDWLAQFTYQAQLIKKLDKLHSNLPDVQEIRRSLDNTLEIAPILESPEVLRQQLDAIAQKINHYFKQQTGKSD